MSKKNLILAAVGVVAIGGSIAMFVSSGSATPGSPAEMARKLATGEIVPERAAAPEAVSRSTTAAPDASEGRLTATEEPPPAEAAPTEEPRDSKRPRSGTRRRVPKRKAANEEPDLDTLVPDQQPTVRESRGNRATRKP